jgi:translation initiation factor IF-2
MSGRGPVATVLVQKGTLRQGDIFVVGEQWGKVRALINDRGERVKEAGPSVPVEVLGLNGTPEAGDVLNVVETEAQAREIANYRVQAAKDKRAAAGAARRSNSCCQGQGGRVVAELPIVVKADVQGSPRRSSRRWKRSATTRSACACCIPGSARSPKPMSAWPRHRRAGHRLQRPRQCAGPSGGEPEGRRIRYYSVIYDLVDDVKAAASGLLSAELRETFIGYAEIKQVFKVSGVGKVAGCLVTEGVARRSAGVRLLRDDVVIHEGTLKTLKRFKDEVKEVHVGQECGMAFENYDDIREGDVIEIFEREEVERTLA